MFVEKILPASNHMFLQEPILQSIVHQQTKPRRSGQILRRRAKTMRSGTQNDHDSVNVHIGPMHNQESPGAGHLEDIHDNMITGCRLVCWPHMMWILARNHLPTCYISPRPVKGESKRTLSCHLCAPLRYQGSIFHVE